MLYLQHPCVVCKKPQCINCQPTLVNIPQETPVERPSKLPNCTVLEYREVTVCSTCFMALLGWEAPAVDTVLSDEGSLIYTHTDMLTVLCILI